MNLIEETPILDEVEVPEQAKKLLALAMENSKIVLKKYPDSKYVDDAVYIIAKSSFLRDEVAVAESYFKQLIRDYPESEFHDLAEIWLTYTHLRMGLVDISRNEIELIQSYNSNGKEELYLIHNILAEISLEEGKIENVYHHYEKSAEYAPSKSKIISTFGKLVLIAEKNQDKLKASEYLVSLGDVAPEKIRIDARMKWITYQRELKNYDAIISEIQRMLGMSEYAPEYMRLELELGKVYKGRGDFELAKEIFGMIVEQYSKKDETAEAYYQLGFMALMEDFNLDLAQEYFENSKLEKSSSFYGRESKEFLNKINHYESLLDLYKESIKNSDEEKELQNENSNYFDVTSIDREDTHISELDENIAKTQATRDDVDKEIKLGDMDFSFQMEGMTPDPEEMGSDSILFMIGEILLYDFNHLERSLEKLKTLVLNYPKSKFAPQSLYVLSHYEPDEDWRHQLDTHFSNSEFLNQDSIMVGSSMITQMEVKRDFAWSLSEISYNESYTEFRRLYTEDMDTLSCYISAYISDYYLNDMGKAIKHYQEFSDNFPNHSYFSKVENRLKIIKTDLSNQKAISKQGMDYKNAVQFFQVEKDFDSTKVLLDDITKGENSHYKDAANRLKAVIRDYQELSNDINENISSDGKKNVNAMMPTPTHTVEYKIDSLIYHLADLFHHELEFVDSAIFYYERVISLPAESQYRPLALMALSELSDTSEWMEILLDDYPDSTFTEVTQVLTSIYYKDIFQEDFITSQEDLINICEIYLDYFSESEVEESKMKETSKLAIGEDANEDVLKREEIFNKPFPDGDNNNYEAVENIIDTKHNGKYDEAENYQYDNNNDKWDEEEEYTDQGNGVYDFGEKFVDINSNNQWDVQIWYVDGNNNKKWNEGEPFEDLDNNGRKSYREPYSDKNKNNSYDPPEKIGNTKFNYLAKEFSEPFTDGGNGRYDIGEPFQDRNGDGKWTAASENVLLNENSIEVSSLFIENNSPISDQSDAEIFSGELYEPFTDMNGNNIWDSAESFKDNNNNNIYDVAENFIDNNHNGKYDEAENYQNDNNNDKWDEEEEYIDQGNGAYDFGENFVDINSNNQWDVQIWYVDGNNNKKWDEGEPFEDLDNDGRKSYREPYSDKNKNNSYDPPEKIGNDKFNYLAKEFSEPFTDSGNGRYDIGEPFQDRNSDGQWSAAEEFDDRNGDGEWNAAEEFEDRNGDGKWTESEEFEDRNGDGKWTAAEEFKDLNSNTIWDKIDSEDIKQDSISIPLDNKIIPIDTTTHTVDSLLQSLFIKSENY